MHVNMYQGIRSLSKATRCVSVNVRIAGHFIVQAVAEAWCFTFATVVSELPAVLVLADSATWQHTGIKTTVACWRVGFAHGLSPSSGSDAFFVCSPRLARAMNMVPKASTTTFHPNQVDTSNKDLQAVPDAARLLAWQGWIRATCVGASDQQAAHQSWVRASDRGGQRAELGPII